MTGLPDFTDMYIQGVHDGEANQRERMIVLLGNHIPSLSDEDERDIDNLVFEIARLSLSFEAHRTPDTADLARRTCHCGVKIDGFYEYVDHLKEVFRG